MRYPLLRRSVALLIPVNRLSSNTTLHKMNPSFSQQNGYMNGSLGQGMNSNGLMGGQGGMNSPMGGGMSNNMMNMMGGGGMNPQMMARSMMNGGGGGGMGQMGANLGLGGMNGGMGGGMGGMGPSGMGGGNAWNNMNNMGGGVGGSGGMGGGMGMGGGGGMSGNPMANGGMVSSMGHNRNNGSSGSFNGGSALTQEQRSSLMSQAMQSMGITREQFASLPQPQQLAVQERLKMMVTNMSQRMAQENMAGHSQSHQQSYSTSSHGFPGSDRPGSTNPSMMPPPPPIRPNTSMSSRSRAPSMESMRPPSAMGMGSPFPKGGMSDQSPIGGNFPKGNMVESSPIGGPYSHASPSASRVPESPRLDGLPSGFPSSSGMGSPTRPMSSASNHSGFNLSAPPARRASISRAATATPVNSEQQIEPAPQTPSFPPRSTPTPAPADVQPSPEMVHPASPPATPARAPTEAPSQPVRKLPPLPASLNKAMTTISMVPLKDSEKLIPELDSTQIGQVKDWIKADTEYEQTYRDMQSRMEKEREALGRRWWERGGGAHGGLPRALNTRNRFDVRYPAARIRKEASNKKGKVERREGFRLYVFFCSTCIDLLNLSPDREKSTPSELRFRKSLCQYGWNSTSSNIKNCARRSCGIYMVG